MMYVRGDPITNITTQSQNWIWPQANKVRHISSSINYAMNLQHWEASSE